MHGFNLGLNHGMAMSQSLSSQGGGGSKSLIQQVRVNCEQDGSGMKGGNVRT